MVIEIELSKQGKNKGKYVAFLSDEDEVLAEFNWAVAHSRKVVYAHRAITQSQARQKLHRVVIERKLNRPLEKHEIVDHIDGNGLNNTRENLRLVTPSQSCMNRSLRVDNKSGLKGVYWNKNVSKWEAQIRVSGKLERLGYFDKKEDAYKVYCERAKEVQGKFFREGGL